MLPAFHATKKQYACPACNAQHPLYKCTAFLRKTLTQRNDLVREARCCANCFHHKHATKDCKSLHSCRVCKKRHHTLLHPSDNTASPPDSAADVSNRTEPKEALPSHTFAEAAAIPRSSILLATTRVKVTSSDGRTTQACALMDQGSAATLIFERLATCLRVRRNKTFMHFSGVGETTTHAKTFANIYISSSKRDGRAYATNAFILPTLTSYSPAAVTRTSEWSHLSGLELADDSPTSNDPIDLLIGEELYGTLLLAGVRKGLSGTPIAQNTKLGWILSGPVAPVTFSAPTNPSVHLLTRENVEFDLRRFWELEEIPRQTHLTEDEVQSEEHFLKTHSRDVDGRYIVRLPFRTEPLQDLGESRHIALTCLSRSERQLQRDDEKASNYRAFMAEYESLGHMTKVPTSEDENTSGHYYIPHHAVFHPLSTTCNLRVVFNASCRSTTGKSLNDLLLPGPKLQADLAAKLLHWRRYRYAYVADIAKMYRQIQVDTHDVDYQRILWRATPEVSVHTYQLRTVTYGTASASYQAMRVLQQLTKDEGAHFPLAVPVLNRQCYVDDCVFSADDVPRARLIREQLVALLKRGGFELRKWASNCPELLADIDPTDHGLACKEFHCELQLKMLRVTWNPSADDFRFAVSTITSTPATKRGILSASSKLFNPLGWAAPVIVLAKLLIQQLWLRRCDWDDLIPPDLQRHWDHYCDTLHHLESVSIPRWTRWSPEATKRELHGFADASSRAYAAVVYERVITGNGTVVISLLVAKTKVAPLKVVSIPRLELCAALLLARLFRFIRTARSDEEVRCHAWTDSTVTLAWLRKSPASWKTFVANRVAAIQTLGGTTQWHHVPTDSNLADCASRGLFGDELKDHTLWWSGLSWLGLTEDHWPQSAEACSASVSEEETREVHLHATNACPTWDLATRFSSWIKLLRVTAVIIRFISRCRKGPTASSTRMNQCVANPKVILVSPHEILAARTYWLRLIQKELFPGEITRLESGSTVHSSSPLAALAPFLDNDGLIRVGGRLRHANIPEDVKHPIVLGSHPLSARIIEHHHAMTMHAGPTLTLASLREEY